MRPNSIFLALAIFAFAGPVAASDLTDCQEPWLLEPSQTIKACTGLIEAKNVWPANVVMAYFNRGDAYWEKGDGPQAIADFSEAIRLDPANVPAYFGRGRVYLQMSDFDHAIADFAAMIRLEPTNEQGHAFLEIAIDQKEDSGSAN